MKIKILQVSSLIFLLGGYALLASVSYKLVFGILAIGISGRLLEHAKRLKLADAIEELKAKFSGAFTAAKEEATQPEQSPFPDLDLPDHEP
jgi:hypothetical protein